MDGPIAAPATRRPLDSAPFVNPFDPAVQADPDAAYTFLRLQTSVARTPLGATVLRRDAVHRLLGDQRLVSALPFLVQAQRGSEASVGVLRDTILAMDGSDHTRLRRLVARSFTPRAADKHRATMRTSTHALVDSFAPGRCEFIAEFADHYPIQVMCEVLGVPRQDHRHFAQWGNALTHLLSLDIGSHVDEIAHAAGGLGAYVDELVEDRRAAPRDDLVSELVEVSEDGDRLNGRELRAMIGGLLFAGYDTARNQLGHALFTFTCFPDQWSLLAAHPELAPQAVDEVMRLHGAVIGVPRIAATEVEIDGWVIPPNTLVFLSLASANRDEALFDEPLGFDITAQRAPHSSFGGGPHYCLGANLARAEMEEALRILPGRLPHLRLDGDVEWRTGTGISGPTHLPLAFEQAGPPSERVAPAT
jgi:cytochrome P450